MGLRLVISGGGTGGHLFPGIAVADEMLRRYPGSEVLFIGTGREIDRRVLRDKPYRQAELTGSGLKGISWRGRLLSLGRLPLGFYQAWKLLRRFSPQLVLGVGGYVTGPVLLAARCMGITTCIHEQNSVPGLANRLLGRFVDHIFLSLPDEGSYFPARRTHLVGNPLRRELVAAAGDHGAPSKAVSSPARQGRDLKSLPDHPAGLPNILVLGGSQGAHRLNMLMARAAALLAARGVRFTLLHQSGRADAPTLQEEYERGGIAARVEAFVEDMAGAYQRSHLVVSRAGATTLAELALFGKPALLVPYPYAADDHQRRNAEIMVAAGAARMLMERELSGELLAAEIEKLLADETGRELMEKKGTELARPEAAAEILQISLADRLPKV